MKKARKLVLKEGNKNVKWKIRITKYKITQLIVFLGYSHFLNYTFFNVRQK